MAFTIFTHTSGRAAPSEKDSPEKAWIRAHLQPVLLAADINVYSFARAFHEAYGIRSLVLATGMRSPIAESSIIDFREVPGLHDPKVFLRVLDDLYRDVQEQFHGEKSLMLIGCWDQYVRMIVENRAQLEDKYILPYADESVLNKIILKQDFYALCEYYGLAYPKTFVHTPATGDDFHLDFDFPVVVKASDSVDYKEHPFQGAKKVFFVNHRAQLLDVLHRTYAAGYSGSMIVQELIPGGDSTMYDLHVYVGRDHRVKLMNLGHVLLEEHSSTGIGSDAATLNTYNEGLMESIRTLLESIGFEGLCDCDIKRDPRDGVFKILEINIRQGRSHYRVTGAGYNLASLLVRDYFLHEPIDATWVRTPYFWHVVPLPVVLAFVRQKATRRQILALIQQGKTSHSLRYPADLSMRRRAKLLRRDARMTASYVKTDGVPAMRRHLNTLARRVTTLTARAHELPSYAHTLVARVKDAV
ncbi:MAG: hypothetical protein SPI12_01330 [Actinomycetaceae bacterium]|nr:hypothetical protein [Actinomycetaceae bacterium]MDY6082489.1 hypothetical protein [Actinomycetaceae bacterium]